MGLSKPPALELAPGELGFTCSPADTVYGEVTLRTLAKKWVYAQAHSDLPWLRVTTTRVSGPQQAAVRVEVNGRLLRPDQVHEGRVKIVANAGQTLELPVRVDVRRAYEPPRRRRLRPLLCGAVAGFLCRLLLAGPADLYARVLAAPFEARPPAGSFASWLESPLAGEAFVKHFVLATWWLGALAGGILVGRRSSRRTDVLFGILAGAVAGLAGSATLACLLPAVDLPPRLLWHQLPLLWGGAGATGPAWLWTAVWIVLAVGCWTAVGGAAGALLGLAGRSGTIVIDQTGQVLSRILRVCGLKRAAQYFVLPRNV
jgi:hypothetical protein